MVVVETPRLVLRPVRLADVLALRAMHGDADVMKTYGHQRVLTQAETEEFVDDAIERYLRDRCGHWIVTQKPSGTVVGHAGLEWVVVDEARELELGYLFAQSHWGNGFATEATRGLIRYAFAVLGAERLVAHTLEENYASRRVLEKLGMTFGGHRVSPPYRERRFYVLERAAWSGGAPALVSPAPPLEAEIRALFADYASAFDRFDAARIASFYDVPCLMVRSCNVALFHTRETLLKSMEELVVLHQRHDCGGAAFTDLRVTDLGDGLTIVTVSWTLRTRAGAVLWQFGTTYNMTRTDDGWRIVVATTHAS